MSGFRQTLLMSTVFATIAIGQVKQTVIRGRLVTDITEQVPKGLVDSASIILSRVSSEYGQAFISSRWTAPFETSIYVKAKGSAIYTKLVADGDPGLLGRLNSNESFTAASQKGFYFATVTPNVGVEGLYFCDWKTYKLVLRRGDRVLTRIQGINEDVSLPFTPTALPFVNPSSGRVLWQLFRFVDIRSNLASIPSSLIGEDVLLEFDDKPSLREVTRAPKDGRGWLISYMDVDGNISGVRITGLGDRGVLATLSLTTNTFSYIPPPVPTEIFGVDVPIQNASPHFATFGVPGVPGTYTHAAIRRGGAWRKLYSPQSFGGDPYRGWVSISGNYMHMLDNLGGALSAFGGVTELGGAVVLLKPEDKLADGADVGALQYVMFDRGSASEVKVGGSQTVFGRMLRIDQITIDDASVSDGTVVVTGGNFTLDGVKAEVLWNGAAVPVITRVGENQVEFAAPSRPPARVSLRIAHKSGVVTSSEVAVSDVSPRAEIIEILPATKESVALSPGMRVSIIGKHLCRSAATTAAEEPWPTTLGGCRLAIMDIEIPIRSVVCGMGGNITESHCQIDALIPSTLKAFGTAVVRGDRVNPEGRILSSSEGKEVLLDATSPTLFTSEGILDVDNLTHGGKASPDSPIMAGDEIQMSGTGFGAADGETRPVVPVQAWLKFRQGGDWTYYEISISRTSVGPGGLATLQTSMPDLGMIGEAYITVKVGEKNSSEYRIYAN